MAKPINIGVQVNSQQFQQFVKSFNALTGQIKNLNAQFAQINAAINKTTFSMKVLNAAMNALWGIANKVGSTIARITRHFLSWHVIVGSVTTLLGMGGGLFGIDRLAASIMAKRRLVMGLGGNYGGIQASLIGKQQLMENPQAALTNTAMGLMGSSDQMTALMTAGIPFGTKEPPEQVLNKYMKWALRTLEKAPPGAQLAVAKGLRMDAILPPDVIMRMVRDPQAFRKEMEDEAKLAEKLKLSPAAQQAWSDLDKQLKIAKANIENAFGEALAKLSGPLTHLSQAFTDLLQRILKMPAVTDLIKEFGDWIESLAEKMKNLKSEDVEKFIKGVKAFIDGIVSLSKQVIAFVQAMGDLIKWIKWLFDPFGLKPFGETDPVKIREQMEKEHAEKIAKQNAVDQAKDAAQKGNTPTPDSTTSPTSTTPDSTTSPTPDTSTKDPPKPFTPPPPTSPVPSDTVPANPMDRGDMGPQVPSKIDPEQLKKQAPFGGRLGAGGGMVSPTTPIDPEQLKKQAGTATPLSIIPKTTGPKGERIVPTTKENPIAVKPNASDIPTGKFQPYGKSNPPPILTGPTKPPVPQPPALTPDMLRKRGQELHPELMGSPQSRAGSQGPLSMNNWQNSKTATLTVRNVPGANVYMSAMGMAG